MHFGTNGVRGKIDELTPKIAKEFAQKIAIYFNKGKILVARDCRLTGDILREAVLSGLAGCEIIDLGIVSSPTAEFMVKKLKADGLIIITASHNPPEYNGLKVVDGDGVAISQERGAEIEKIKISKNQEKKAEVTYYDHAVDDHINAIKKLVDIEKIKKKKIVLDCGNGTACTIAPKLFKELGCEILTINSHMDGRFPGRGSEPTEKNVQDMISLVKSSNADAGIAWDGDADRIIFVDEKGNYIIGDKVFGLCVIWKLSKEKGDVVTTVATSKAIEEIVKSFGCNTRYTAIGAPYLCEDIMKKPAVLGGEEVGGIIWPEIDFAKEGILTAAKMLEALSEKPLSEWIKQIPEYHIVKEKIPAKEKEKKEIVKEVLEYAKKKKLRYNTIDGVRVDFDDSWVIVRPSGTEEYVRIFAEAKTIEKAKELIEQYKKIAKD